MNLEIVIELCKHFEGFRSRPYSCPAGVATIGYGSTSYVDGTRVTLADSPMDEDAATALLLVELEHTYLPGVLANCPGLATDELRCNGLVDFCYNLGVGRLQTSTLKRRVNDQDWKGVKEQLLRWNRGGGQILPGLVRRRHAECDLI